MPSVPLDCTLPAEGVLLALRAQPWPFALTGRWAGGGAIVGSAPRELLGAGDPFEALEGLPRARGDADVGGGWFGWLGYGLESRAGELPPGPPRVVPLPDAHLGFYDNVLRLDGAGRWWFESLGEPGARLDDVRARLAAAPASVPPAPATFAARAAAHIAAVCGCVARIAAGEMSRVHLCLRLGAQWEDDVVALFARAATRLRPAYGACFVAPWGGVASCSPEPFPRPSAPAMTAIAELETTGREVHSGLIGFAARRPGWSSASPSGHLRPAADGCGSASAAPSTPILTRRVSCRSAWSKPDAWLPRWAA